MSLGVCAGIGMLVALSACVGPASAGITKLEGEYQLMLDARQRDRAYRWDFDFNNNDTWTGAQFRLFTVPFANTEAFIKFEGDYNNSSNNYLRPVFQYRESHLRYRWDKKTWGADTYLFQRQNRFWFERHLIEIISPGQLDDSGNAQGVRLDLWGLGDTKLTYLLSDYSGQSSPGTGSAAGAPVGTDDAHALRLRREAFGDRMRVGFTYGRRVDRQDADASSFQEVWAEDLRLRLKQGVDLLVEYADSRARGVAQHDEGSFAWDHFSPRHLERWLPSDGELRAEVRTLRAGNPKFGYYNVVPSLWYIGPGYTNALENFNNNAFGNGGSDEQGFFLNTWYLIPARAITLTAGYAARERLVFEQRETRRLYTEMYTEYRNGFTSKLAYIDRWDRVRGAVGSQITKNRDVFAEAQVETRLAWMRVQGKLKDSGTQFQKELASLETSVNLTRNVKLYSRFTFGNDPARLRKGIFSQIQYRPRGNMEVFLEYGPGWIGDSPNPVDDGDLAGSAEQVDLVKLIMKGTF